MKQLALSVHWRAEATFDSFATGCNAEIVAALRHPISSPVWLWGGAGSGKTHLLQAVCEAGASAAYLPLNRTAALHPAALLGFETCRVLCLDDVDAVAGDVGWEGALFHLFNEAADLNTRLVFAARAAPRQLEWRLKDWRSRAAACVVYQLRELDEAGRVEALRSRAEQRGLELPQETAEYLLRRMPRDLVSLYGVLDKLDQASLIAQRRLTIPFIREVLEMLSKTAP